MNGGLTSLRGGQTPAAVHRPGGRSAEPPVSGDHLDGPHEQRRAAGAGAARRRALETDDGGRLETFGKVALTVVVGNEDGGHAITADLFQGLNDVGFTVPATGGVYWNGEAMTTTDYKDLDETPEAVASTMATMSANAAHLAALLKERPYPPA
jgi:hypothetical protein